MIRYRLSFFLLLFPLLYASVYAEGYYLEKEIIFPEDPKYSSHYLQIPFIRQKMFIFGQPPGTTNGLDNKNYYDLENDGIPEFLDIKVGVGTKIDIYDGANYALKHTVIIDSFGVAYAGSVTAIGFLDVDGDGTKELVGEFSYNTSGLSRFKILFIDVQSGSIEYSIPGYHPELFPDGYDGYSFYDIDNDSYPEVICRVFTDYKSLKIRVYGSTPSAIAKRAPTLAKQRSVDVKNYPNPFSNSTKIEYYVSTTDNVTLKIFNSEGRLIRTLLNKPQPIGEYTVTWDGKDDGKSKLAPGQYYYQIKIGKFTSTQRMISLQ